jgi:hypothetical protein
MKKANEPRKRKPAWKIGLVLAALAAAGTWYAVSHEPSAPGIEQRAGSQQTAAPSPPAAGPDTAGIPPFYKSAAAAKPFPRLLPAANFTDALVASAYRAAAEIPGVAAQQPCYCHCDKFGHRSLLDCYASTHGAG